MVGLGVVVEQLRDLVDHFSEHGRPRDPGSVGCGVVLVVESGTAMTTER
jgi:hypothetical protein